MADEAPNEIYGKPFHGWSCSCEECVEFTAAGDPRPGEAPRAVLTGDSPTFEQLLSDPNEQLDRHGEMLPLILGQIVPAPDGYGYAYPLCDPDGIVRGGAMHHGTDYPCTGSAHYAGAHILCTTAAHKRGAVQ